MEAYGTIIINWDPF